MDVGNDVPRRICLNLMTDCGGGLRGSFPKCIDCQIVDAMKKGE